MNPSPATSKRFYCFVEDKLEGPFEAVELAGQLKCSAITGSTLICREGEEEWIPFRDLPEFGPAQAMSIDAIARQLEKKQGVPRSPIRPRTPSLIPWLMAAFVGGLLVIAGFLLFPASPTPVVPAQALSSPVAQAVWPQSDFDHFSVACPATLIPTVSRHSKSVERYRVTVGKTVFGVDTAVLPETYNASQRDEQIYLTRDAFLKPSGCHLISEHGISGTGYYGQELLFTQSLDSKVISTRVRIISGGRNLSSVWVATQNDEFSPEDINRYLTSFEVR